MLYSPLVVKYFAKRDACTETTPRRRPSYWLAPLFPPHLSPLCTTPSLLPQPSFPARNVNIKLKKKRKKINFNFNFEYEFDNNAGVGNNAGERRWQPAKGVKRKQTREAVDRVKRFLKSLIKWCKQMELRPRGSATKRRRSSGELTRSRHCCHLSCAHRNNTTNIWFHESRSYTASRSSESKQSNRGFGFFSFFLFSFFNFWVLMKWRIWPLDF